MTEETATGRVIAIQERVFWEVDRLQHERGILRVEAELLPTPERYRQLLVSEGSDVHNYQWETERATVYPARADGTLLDDRDGETRLFTDPAAATRWCVELLQRRIARDMSLIEKLTARYLTPISPTA